MNLEIQIKTFTRPNVKHRLGQGQTKIKKVSRYINFLVKFLVITRKFL